MLLEGCKNPPTKAPEHIKEPRKPNPDWVRYKIKVQELTKQQPLESLTDYHLRGWDYQLDHIISIWDGFKWGINPEIIADISNLTILKQKDNAIKGRRSYSIL